MSSFDPRTVGKVVTVGGARGQRAEESYTLALDCESGNPAVLDHYALRPVALRPRLSTGLLFHPCVTESADVASWRQGCFVRSDETDGTVNHMSNVPLRCEPRERIERF